MTGAPADIRKYFYWSERRITKIAGDGGVRLQRSGSTKLKSPGLPFLPAAEFDRPRPPLSRPETAAIIERYLSNAVVRDFVTPPQVRFAAGCGALAFAEFRNFGRRVNIVSIFTNCLASDGTRVAIGMFGSRDNLSEVITTTPADTGWTASAAPEIFSFISSFGTEIDTYGDGEDLARQAVRVLTRQGGPVNDGEKRPFTYGHIGEYGEWLLEAYLDVEFREKPIRSDAGTFDRVVIGAPLWVRTPAPQALMPYGDPDRL